MVRPALVVTACVVLALMPVLAGTALAQDTMAAPVQYIAGDRPWKCGRGRCEGTLVIADGSFALTERKRKNAKVIFWCRSRPSSR